MKKMFITVSNQGNAGKSTISNICIDYLRNVLKVPCAVYLADSGAEQDRVLVMHGMKGARNQNALTGVKVIDLLCKNSQTEIESEKKIYADEIKQEFIEEIMDLPDDCYIFIDLPVLNAFKHLYEPTFGTKDEFFNVLNDILDLDLIFLSPLQGTKGIEGLTYFYNDVKTYPVKHIIIYNDFGGVANIQQLWQSTETYKEMSAVQNSYFEMNVPLLDKDSIDLLKDAPYSSRLEFNNSKLPSTPTINQSAPKREYMKAPYNYNVFNTIQIIFNGTKQKNSNGVVITKHLMQDFANIIPLIWGEHSWTPKINLNQRYS